MERGQYPHQRQERIENLEQWAMIGVKTSAMPYPARRRHHHRSPELHRRPDSANNNSAKQKCRRQPAAAAPLRRLEPVGLLGAAAADAARPAIRAREGSE
jgi:hypothetical protein